LGLISKEEYLIEENKYKGGYSTYNRSIVYFQLTYKADNKIIGAAGFHNWLDEHKRAEIGYALKDDHYKNKGLMNEALSFIINYGFEKMDLHRVEAYVGTNNVPSLKLMSKYKFVKEGLLREHYFINNVFEDSVVFSLLRDEYLSNKQS
jgi:RimJ/RimL family protein N-acetyltransferase